MNKTNPANLAVLACPGGEVFAEEVIADLSSEYRRRFEKMAGDLARQYDMDIGSAIRRINFINDALSPSNNIPGDIQKYRSPRFRVSAKFTLFPNGEIKAEIMESIRGKDI
jgi:ribose-phosphate pyrophosphokinase